MRDRLKSDLDPMETVGIIVKVSEPTDWVNSLVLVEKPNGTLHICLEPRDLNKAMKLEHYRLPVLEDVISNLKGVRYFSKLDARSGCWQIKLDESSSVLTSFNTPYDRYHFTRMPFGIHSAQEVLKKRQI